MANKKLKFYVQTNYFFLKIFKSISINYIQFENLKSYDNNPQN